MYFLTTIRSKIFTLFLSFISIFCLASKGQNISNGLIQHYPFLNGTKDESGHSPNALVYPANYSRDMHGYAEGSPTLIGNSYYIEFPDSVNLGKNGWTFSVWFKLNGLPSEIYEGDAFLLTYKNTNYGDDVHLFVDDDDNAIKVFFNNGFFKISTGVTVQRGKWYHAVLRYTSTTTDVFVDGNFTLSSSGRFTPKSYYSPLIVSSLYNGSTSKGRIFGSIDDIRMYKRALSNADISLLYNTEKNMVAPPVTKDTVLIRDTIIKRDTITIIQRETIVKLDTIILGGSCIISPNPASNGRLYIQTNDRPASVIMYNAAGQLIKKEELTVQDYIKVNGIPSGIYFIKIITPSGTCGKKIMIVN